MPIDFPTLQQLVDSSRTDVRSELPTTDPTVFGSFLRALTDAVGTRAYDQQLLIEQLLDQAFPQSAVDEYLDRWAGYEDLERLSATSATGDVVVTGLAGSTIPTNTSFSSVDGTEYLSTGAVSLTSQTFNITALTFSGGAATATTVDHNLATGIEITVAGAVETEYNGVVVVTVVDEDTFTYPVTGTPSSPATGTITGSFSGAIVSVESSDTGSATNQSSGAVLSLTSPVSGVDEDAFVRMLGVQGGSDDETDDQLRVRVLQSRENIIANFNAAAIEKQARTVAGVTRVFVKPITPSVGDVTIYFMRDGDLNPFPDAGEVNAVKAAIVEILPANSDEGGVIVSSPSPVTTNYTFSAISPDTTTMRSAISANLQAFYDDSVEFEVSITEDKYRSAIINTQDTETGDFLQSFTLSSPSADITISDGEIGVLGTVSFP